MAKPVDAGGKGRVGGDPILELGLVVGVDGGATDSGQLYATRFHGARADMQGREAVGKELKAPGSREVRQQENGSGDWRDGRDRAGDEEEAREHQTLQDEVLAVEVAHLMCNRGEHSFRTELLGVVSENGK